MKIMIANFSNAPLKMVYYKISIYINPRARAILAGNEIVSNIVRKIVA